MICENKNDQRGFCIYKNIKMALGGLVGHVSLLISLSIIVVFFLFADQLRERERERERGTERRQMQSIAGY